MINAQLLSFKMDYEIKCYICFRKKINCLCHLIKPFDTNIQFVILIHPMEAKKEKLGTGRMTKSILKNSKLIMGVDFSLDEEVNSIIQNKENSCYVLYPGVATLNVSSDDLTPLENKKIVLFVIDGTWPCAKKMMKLSSNINTLPRISFTANHQSIFEIKEQPADYCLSTIESIHFFLSECERRGIEQLDPNHLNMLDVFKAMIAFQIKCANDPSIPSFRPNGGGYSKKEDRIKAKKWEKRKILHT